MSDTYSTVHEREAFKMGADAAKAAASWVIDGNTSPEHIARVLAMLDDGDPAAEQSLPARPDLSGEWADAPTPASLYIAIIGAEPDEPDETLDAIAHAWEAGVAETFEPECERIMREAIR